MDSIVEILLVEDNPADVRLTLEAFKDSKILNRLNVVNDGVEAIQYLKKEGNYTNSARPDMVLLDLNLPKKNGKEVLAEVKSDEKLKTIPIVVLTTSQSEEDINHAYQLHANCYVTKPVDFDNFMRIIGSIEDFWLTVAKLPPR